MDEAIKAITIPFLRKQGFKGSFPHFRRVKTDRINLLTFQFNMYEPKFVVEIANCSSEGIYRGWGSIVLPNKCTAHDMFNRHRLGSKATGDSWFDFGKTSFFSNVYQKLAKDVIDFWTEAEDWWERDKWEQRLMKPEGDK
ncbi:hypothetical protein GCM10028827_12480 [Mucilaginibacter myungsuensis]